MYQDPSLTRSLEIRVATPSGVLAAQVIEPARMSNPTPLVLLHGISRNADELAALFVPEARRTGRRIVVPHFPADVWPVFQRPAGRARPDQALLALLARLAEADPDFDGQVDLFGHSGGAQLAHRFAMLYPHKVARLNLVAAGWYCLPDTSLPYPYGLGIDSTSNTAIWARRKAQGLSAYLQLPVRVFVGTNDTDRDASLRQVPMLDFAQGPTRLARAACYVARFRAAAAERRIRPDIELTLMQGVRHDVAEAVRVADLARIVTDASCNAPARTR